MLGNASVRLGEDMSSLFNFLLILHCRELLRLVRLPNHHLAMNDQRLNINRDSAERSRLFPEIHGRDREETQRRRQDSNRKAYDCVRQVAG